jgi:membrane protein DedA with SNARE-associated domain
MDPVRLAEGVQHLSPALLYAIVVIWLSFESAGVPIPNEAILLFSGYLASTGHINPAFAAASGLAGSLVGATVSYWIGYRFGYPGVRRFGHYIFLGEHRLEAAERWFHRRGHLTIFLARLVPVIRTVISYPAGIARMPYWPFLVATLCGAAIWCALVVAAGMAVGSRWVLIFDWFHRLGLLAAALLAVLVVAYVIFELRMRRSTR